MKKLLLSTAFICLLATPSFAAQRVWISEFGVLGATNSGGSPAQIAALPALVNQSSQDFTSAPVTSPAFNGQTRFIRVYCEVNCAVKVGGTATVNDTPLPAGSAEYFGVQPGATISIIANP